MGRKKNKSEKNENHKEIKGLIIISIGILCMFSLYTNSVGTLGKVIKNISMGLLSKPAYVFPYLIVASGILSLNNNFKKYRAKFLLSSISIYFCYIIIYALIYRSYIPNQILTIPSLKIMYLFAIDGFGGGIIGSIFTSVLLYIFGVKGSYIVLATFFLVTIILTTNITISKLFITIFKSLNQLYISTKNKFKNLFLNIKMRKGSNGYTETDDNGYKQEINKEIVDEKIKILDYTSIKDAKIKKDNNNEVNDIVKHSHKANEISNNNNEDVLKMNSSNNIANFKIPSINILNASENKNSKNSKKDILIKAKILEDTLSNFGVDAKVVQISKGPTITRYELQPSPGVKVSKIVSLTDDIALNLAAENIRIEAPIPGKSAVGIEIPNEHSIIVTLREVIESKVFYESDSKLTFALGKNISGNPIVADLAKMPHMLIAGATGSGKSVCVNTLITSILFKSTPDEVKFLLIDPKVVELSNYNGIPHLLLPVVTDPKKAASALNWVVQEMTNRYKLFAQNGVRDIDSYNEFFKNSINEKLPKLVVIIDELADLMIVAPNQVEDAICRLAQMARAAGIHLIVATQRPSVDVITGVIKANIPSRISFAVSSQIDSRTILDMGGAEKLLGRGDMLFYPVGSSKPVRVQGAFVSDSEVKAVVDHMKSQVDNVTYEEDIISEIENPIHEEEVDELLSDAIDLVIDVEQASISMLQRKFRIGYNRAARLVDEMEKRGIVSEHLGSKPRNVLISKEEFQDIKGQTS